MSEIKLPPLPEWLQEQNQDTNFPVSTMVTAMRQYARAAIELDRQGRGEPVAFAYELAVSFNSDGTCAEWSPRLSFAMPNVPDGGIRNLHWLYSAPQPAEPHPPTRHCMCAECAPSFEDEPAEPVKVPSDDEIIDLLIGNGFVDRVRDFLGRYGQPAQPTASAESVGRVRHYQYSGIARNSFSQEAVLNDDAPDLPDGALLYTAPVAAQPTGKPDLHVAAQPSAPEAISRAISTYGYANRHPDDSDGIARAYEALVAAIAAAQPSVPSYPTDEWVRAFFGKPDETGFYHFHGDFGNIAFLYGKAMQTLANQPLCAECGKKASDGWALYCVACGEVAHGQQDADKVDAERYRWLLEQAWFQSAMDRFDIDDGGMQDRFEAETARIIDAARAKQGGQT